MFFSTDWWIFSTFPFKVAGGFQQYPYIPSQGNSIWLSVWEYKWIFKQLFNSVFLWLVCKPFPHTMSSTKTIYWMKMYFKDYYYFLMIQFHRHRDPASTPFSPVSPLFSPLQLYSPSATITSSTFLPFSVSWHCS